MSPWLLFNVYIDAVTKKVKMRIGNEFRRGNYYGRKTIMKTEIEVRVRQLKKRKYAGKDKGHRRDNKGGDSVVDWIWRLCNIAL